MTLRIFESVFYKSPIRACSFENSLAANQNVRSYGQTFNHRALRICKKCIQKVLMLSPFFPINISSYLLSDSYNKTLFKPLHSVYVIRYWLMFFCIRWQKMKETYKHRFLEMFMKHNNITFCLKIPCFTTNAILHTHHLSFPIL